MSDETSRVLDKLAKDVEPAVHALYRGERERARAALRKLTPP